MLLQHGSGELYKYRFSAASEVCWYLTVLLYAQGHIILQWHTTTDLRHNIQSRRLLFIRTAFQKNRLPRQSCHPASISCPWTQVDLYPRHFLSPHCCCVPRDCCQSTDPIHNLQWASHSHVTVEALSVFPVYEGISVLESFATGSFSNMLEYKCFK